MAAPDRKTPRLDPSSQAPEVYTHSSLPEVYAQPSTLPEATTPAHGYHHHHQYKEEQSWGQPPSAVSSHAYSESQGGWTSVSQGVLETVAEQAGDKSGQGGNSEGEQKQQQPKTIMGLPRRKFWLIIGPLLLLLAIGLAVGLGVGLSARTASAAATAASAAPTPVACPADNGTIYTPAATNGGGGSNISSFMIVCDTDYNGNDPASGTTDLASKACGSVEECMAICAGNRDCAGAWFGDYFGRKCFLKSRLGVSHFSQNSFFVIKQQS